jgi:hypothetical protein
VDVIVSDGARDYVKTHGGVVYVSTHAHRCCHGAITLLDTTTAAPGGGEEVFRSVGDGEIDVRFRGDPGREPHQLVIELRGRRRDKLVSYWDGCAFRP